MTLIKLDTQITTGHKLKSIKCIHQYQDHIMTDDDFKVFCRQCKAEFELMPTKDDERHYYKPHPKNIHLNDSRDMIPPGQYSSKHKTQ